MKIEGGSVVLILGITRKGLLAHKNWTFAEMKRKILAWIKIIRFHFYPMTWIA